MTKPIVSLGIMQLAEDGHLLLNDPLSKFIPEFAEQRVGIERNGALEYALPARPITIQDLLRHTSGLVLRDHRRRHRAADVCRCDACEAAAQQRRTCIAGSEAAIDVRSPARSGITRARPIFWAASSR